MDILSDGPVVEFLIKITAATICGSILGLERQLRGKPFGVRTSSLICVGTTLFLTLGQSLSGGLTDPSRV